MNQSVDLTEGSRTAPASEATGRGWYLVTVLMLAYAVSYIDRQVLNLLIGFIKVDFALSDTQLSLLQGMAFTSAYVIFGPVFGRMADTGNRRTILIFGVLIWSLGTALCGLARDYTGLFAARFLVGGAEACMLPAALSMISDRFTPQKLPRAIGVFMIAPYLGGGLALIFGGLLLGSLAGIPVAHLPILGNLHPWQIVFIVTGLPGLAIILMMLGVSEPRRRDLLGEGQIEKARWSEVARAFAARRGFYIPFYLGMAALVIVLYGFPAWMPTVLMRRFGVSAQVVGAEYGMLVLVSGLAGTLASPALAAWCERRGHRDALIFVPFCAAFVLFAAAAAIPFAQSYVQMLVIATIASCAYSVPQALAATALQLVTPNRMRGVAVAGYVFVASMFGLGAAPTIVALITDKVFADESRLGDSLAITCGVAAAVAAVLLHLARRAYVRLAADLRDAE